MKTCDIRAFSTSEIGTKTGPGAITKKRCTSIGECKEVPEVVVIQFGTQNVLAVGLPKIYLTDQTPYKDQVTN